MEKKMTKATAWTIVKGIVAESNHPQTEELVAALLEEYDVDETTAKAHVAAFVEKLNGHGFLA